MKYEDKVLCSVYKSSRKEEMYLYVPRETGLKEVPETLLASFGDPQHVMDLLLHPGKKLARVDIGRVLEELDDAGFFLQMPPSPAALAAAHGAKGGPGA